MGQKSTRRTEMWRPSTNDILAFSAPLSSSFSCFVACAMVQCCTGAPQYAGQTSKWLVNEPLPSSSTNKNKSHSYPDPRIIAAMTIKTAENYTVNSCLWCRETDHMGRDDTCTLQWISCTRQAQFINRIFMFKSRLRETKKKSHLSASQHVLFISSVPPILSRNNAPSLKYSLIKLRINSQIPPLNFRINLGFILIFYCFWCFFVCSCIAWFSFTIFSISFFSSILS